MAIGSLTAILGLASTALSVVGAFQAAKAQQAQARYQAQVAQNNAEIARQNIEDARKRGRQAEYEKRLQIARALGKQRAATAGAGLLVDEAGSTPDDLMQEMAEAGELDVLKIRDNVIREQRKWQIQEMGFLAQEDQYNLQADSVKPGLAALTAGLGGIAQNADVLFPNAGVTAAPARTSGGSMRPLRNPLI